jgi:large subunit ribosomal protein L5
MVRLMEKYKTEVMPALGKELGTSNPLAIPRINKIVVSMGVGKAVAEKTRMAIAAKELSQITGQKALICKSKKSVSNFKLRENLEIGAKVTLRGKRMYEFLDRLISLAIPRVRDFRGLDPKSFDGRGNFNMGVSEQTVFPEVESDKVQFQQGMNITFVTSATKDADARKLLSLMGLPFRKTDGTGGRAA